MAGYFFDWLFVPSDLPISGGLTSILTNDAPNKRTE
jgi:hypothetical protein